jgi:hypothetical protein
MREEPVLFLLRESKVAELGYAANAVQKTENNSLPVRSRHGFNAHVDHPVAKVEREASTLRYPALGNVQAAEHLQPAHERTENGQWSLRRRDKHAVDAKAHAYNVRERLDMNVGCPIGYRLLEQRGRQAHDRAVSDLGILVGDSGFMHVVVGCVVDRVLDLRLLVHTVDRG